MAISMLASIGCKPCAQCSGEDKVDAEAPTTYQGDDALQMTVHGFPGLHSEPSVTPPDQSRRLAMEDEERKKVAAAKEAEEKKKAAAAAAAKAKAKKEADEKKRLEEEAARAEKARKDMEAEEAARRERLGPLGHPNARLQVYLDDGWKDFSTDEFKQVCDQVAGGMTRFTIQARGIMYVVDWSDPSAPAQINVQSGKKRQLRVATN